MDVEVNSMRRDYKIFAIMVGLVIILSFSYNVNKSLEYLFWNKGINEKLFGLSYTIPLVVCAYMICKNARTGVEKVICKVFLWITFSAFVDEILFDPFRPQMHEHIIGLIITLIFIHHARSKKISN